MALPGVSSIWLIGVTISVTIGVTIGATIVAVINADAQVVCLHDIAGTTYDRCSSKTTA